MIIVIQKRHRKMVSFYYYTDRDTMFSSYDSFSENLETALEEFDGEFDDRGWIMVHGK